MSSINPRQEIPAPFRRAVLFSDREEASRLGPITERTPSWLLPLAGKALADRIAGSLSDLGVCELTLFLSSHTDVAASFFDDGARWGIRLHLVDVRDGEQMIERLKRFRPEEAILFGSLCCWPNLNREVLEAMTGPGNAVLALPSGEPAGWAAIYPETLSGLEAASPMEMLRELRRLQARSVPCPGPHLNCTTPADILGSTRVLLRKELEGQLIPGASGDSGIWMGAGCVLHPTVRLEPPVWIGENSRLDRGVRLGPNASVADNCVLGEFATLENCSVLSGTCIGDQVELKDVVVDRNYLAYTDASQAVAIPDPFLIAPNDQLRIVPYIAGLTGRLAALVLFLAVLPLLGMLFLLARMLGCRRPIKFTDCVRLPVATDPMLWKTFRRHRWSAGENRLWNRCCRNRILEILPAIQDIAFSRLHWVGLAPRDSAEVLALPEDWRALYLSSKAGLFQLSETDQRCLGDFSPDQQYSSEVFYAATRTLRMDALILLRSLFQVRRRETSAPRPAILSAFSGPEILDRLHRFLCEQFSAPDMHMAADRKNEIVTAIHEAVTNILRHAYGNESGCPVQLHVLRQSGRIAVDLYDRGRDFQTDQIPPPDFSVEADGGFGWYLIGSIADSVNFSCTENGWNHLSLTFICNPKGEIKNEY